MVRIIELLSLCMIVICVVVRAQDGHHFEIYNFGNADLYRNGIAAIEEGRLKLTNNSKSATGNAFHSTPIRFSNTSFSFSTEFVFSIIPESDSLHGQGMAFLVSPDAHLRYGAESSYLGIFSKMNDNRSDNHVFAIEIDTYQNPEALDKSDNHIGIDINSILSVEYANAAYFDDNTKKNTSLVLASKQRLHIWIDYEGDLKLLRVTLAPFMIPKPSLPLLSRRMDLSNIFKDQQMYLGFSGSTSKSTSQQYILGWAFTLGRKAKSLDLSRVLDIPAQPGLSNGVVIVISTVSAILLVVILSVVRYYYCKKKSEPWEQEYSPQRFSFKILYNATGGFHDTQILGSGGFGTVYRGQLRDGSQVAIKRVSKGSDQGMSEYASEISTLGRLGHMNIVQLLGYCRRKQELFLVYEFLPNGSVSDYLLNGNTLDWCQRVNIVKGVASALHYLHECLDRVLLHRDVKTSNVLLDANLNGKLGDFGLAKFHERGKAVDVTRSGGTYGYMAPEILTPTGVPSVHTDVYAFGAFVLEVICGRKPVEPNRPHDQVMLVNLVANSGKTGSLIDTIDTRLSGEFGEEDAKLILKLGMLCLQKRPEDRPSMREILEYIQGSRGAPNISFDDTAEMW